MDIHECAASTSNCENRLTGSFAEEDAEQQFCLFLHSALYSAHFPHSPHIKISTITVVVFQILCPPPRYRKDSGGVFPVFKQRNLATEPVITVRHE